MFGPSLTRPECVAECRRLLAPPVNPWWANKRYASERKAAGITFAKKATRASFRRRNSMKNKVVTKKTLKRMGLLNTLKKARTKTDKQPPQNDIEPTEKGMQPPTKDKEPTRKKDKQPPQNDIEPTKEGKQPPKKDKEQRKNYKQPPQNDIEPTEEGKHGPKKDKHPLKKDKELGKNYKHPQTMTKASTKELYPSHHQSPPHKSLRHQHQTTIGKNYKDPAFVPSRMFGIHDLKRYNIPAVAWPQRESSGQHSYTITDREAKVQVLLRDRAYYVIAANADWDRLDKPVRVSNVEGLGPEAWAMVEELTGWGRPGLHGESRMVGEGPGSTKDGASSTAGPSADCASDSPKASTGDGEDLSSLFEESESD